MKEANESAMMFCRNEQANRADRELFVENLGWLLAQTREDVVRCWLDDADVVHIVYRGGGEHLANVHMDSYAAIVRDVAARL